MPVENAGASPGRFLGESGALRACSYRIDVVVCARDIDWTPADSRKSE